MKLSTDFKNRLLWSLVSAAVAAAGAGVFVAGYQLFLGSNEPPRPIPYSSGEKFLIVMFTAMTPIFTLMMGLSSVAGRWIGMTAVTWVLDRLGWRPSLLNRVMAGLVVHLVPTALAWLPVIQTGHEGSEAARSNPFGLDPFIGGATLGDYELSLGFGSAAAAGLLAGLVYRAGETGLIARLLQPRPAAPPP